MSLEKKGPIMYGRSFVPREQRKEGEEQEKDL